MFVVRFVKEARPVRVAPANARRSTKIATVHVYPQPVAAQTVSAVEERPVCLVPAAVPTTKSSVAKAANVSPLPIAAKTRTAAAEEPVRQAHVNAS